MSPKYARPVRICPEATINPPPREGVSTPGSKVDEPIEQPDPKKEIEPKKQPEPKTEPEVTPKSDPKKKGM
jgi:hypothetical protein